MNTRELIHAVQTQSTAELATNPFFSKKEVLKPSDLAVINGTDENGMSPLYHACLQLAEAKEKLDILAALSMISFLLEKEASLNTPDATGKRPIDILKENMAKMNCAAAEYINFMMLHSSEIQKNHVALNKVIAALAVNYQRSYGNTSLKEILGLLFIALQTGVALGFRGDLFLNPSHYIASPPNAFPKPTPASQEAPKDFLDVLGFGIAMLIAMAGVIYIVYRVRQEQITAEHVEDLLGMLDATFSPEIGQESTADTIRNKETKQNLAQIKIQINALKQTITYPEEKVPDSIMITSPQDNASIEMENHSAEEVAEEHVALVPKPVLAQDPRGIINTLSKKIGLLQYQIARSNTPLSFFYQPHKSIPTATQGAALADHQSNDENSKPPKRKFSSRAYDSE